MGWKAVKDHYRIEHIVQIRDGLICIGSGYIHDLIAVTMEGEIVKPEPHKERHWTRNEDLLRYLTEMRADPAKLLELIQQADTFEKSLPVFTWGYPDHRIIEHQCEEYGWPNVTHEGLPMYDNSFFVDRAKAVEKAIETAKYAMHQLAETIQEKNVELWKLRDRKAIVEASLSALNREKERA